MDNILDIPKMYAKTMSLVVGNILAHLGLYKVRNIMYVFLGSPVSEWRRQWGLNRSSLLDMLPDEILMEIFTYLHFMDVETGLRPLCNKRIRKVCQIPLLYRHVHLGQWDLTRARRVIVNAGSSLNCLVLSTGYGNDNNQLAMLALERCQNLEWLWCYQEDVSAPLLQAIGQSPSVSKLSLRVPKTFLDLTLRLGHQCSGLHCCSFASLFASNASCLRSLRHIDIQWSAVGNNDDGWMQAVADNCYQLECLIMPLAFMPRDQPFNYLLHKVKDTLRSLSVSTLHLTNDFYINLKQCVHLKELKLAAYHLDREDLLALGRVSKGLKHLAVSGARFSAQDFASAFKFNGSSINSLVTLDLFMCEGLDDIGLDAIAKICDAIAKICPNLKYAQLTGCNVGDHGIISVLQHCPKLARLGLFGTNVTREAFAQFSYRRKLCLDIKPDLAAYVAKFMPFCHVHQIGACACKWCRNVSMHGRERDLPCHCWPNCPLEGSPKEFSRKTHKWA